MILIGFIKNHSSDIVNTFTRVTQAMKVAVILRCLRNAFGLSQSELARQANCSRPTINRIETLDKASPRSDIVDDLLQVFLDKGNATAQDAAPIANGP